jgi:hypothetical protein
LVDRELKAGKRCALFSGPHMTGNSVTCCSDKLSFLLNVLKKLGMA